MAGTIHILIFITGVYFGEATSTAPGFFNDKAACDSAGARWLIEAKAVQVRSARYICLPKYP